MNIIKKITRRLKSDISDFLSKKTEITQDKKFYDNSKIQIHATGCWETFRPNFLKQPFFQAFTTAYKNAASLSLVDSCVDGGGGYTEFQYSSYKPQIEFFSVNSKVNAINHSKAKIKIFYTGEDVNENYTNFKSLLLDKTDLSLGFDYPEDRNNAANYLRYPYWMLCCFCYTEDKDKIKAEIERINSYRNNANRFCGFVAFHDNRGIRKEIIDIINEIDTVSCGGNAYHNDDSLKKEFNDDKNEWLKNFKFNICPENVNVKGYTTEKLFQAFYAGCIPIYYGDCENPEKYVINKDALIIYNRNNKDEVFERVKELNTNQKYYDEFISQKRILDSAVDYIYEMNHSMRMKYEEIIKIKGFV